MGRKPCCDKEGLNRGAWTALEDQTLVSYIKTHGEGKWRNLPKKAGLNRCGKSCRLRWLNYLRPGIKRGNISADEEELIIRLHKLLGNRWSLIAGRLPGRTDNEIKNYWNTTLGKRVVGVSCQPRGNSGFIPDSDPSPEAAAAAGPDKNTAIIQTKAQRCTRTFFHRQQAPELQPASPPSPALVAYSQQLHQLLTSNYASSQTAQGEEIVLQKSSEGGGGGDLTEDPCLSMSLDDVAFVSQGLSENFLDIDFDISSTDFLVDTEDEWTNLLDM